VGACRVHPAGACREAVVQARVGRVAVVGGAGSVDRGGGGDGRHRRVERRDCRRASGAAVFGRRVGADDVLEIVRVGVEEGERVGPEPEPLAVLGSEPVHEVHDLALHLDHTLETLLHVRPVLGVDEVEARLAQKLLRRVAEQVHQSLVSERELSVGRMAGNKLSLRRTEKIFFFLRNLRTGLKKVGVFVVGKPFQHCPMFAEEPTPEGTSFLANIRLSRKSPPGTNNLAFLARS